MAGSANGSAICRTSASVPHAIILQIPSVEEVFFGGMCEPLFHPQIVQKDAPVSARWRTYMRDVFRMEREPKSGAQPHLEQVFFFGGR